MVVEGKFGVSKISVEFDYSLNFEQMTLLKDAKICLGILAVAGTMLLAACNSKEPITDLLVHGTIQDHANAFVYLDYVVPGGNQVVDSVKTDPKGAFTLHSHSPNEGIYAVRLPNRQSLICYLDANPVQVEANAGQFSRGKISGNKGSLILAEFNTRRSRLRNDYVRQMRDLVLISKDTDPVEWAKQEQESDQKSLAYREYVTQFADTVSVPELAHFAVYNLNTEGDFYAMQQYAETQKAKGITSPFLTSIEASCKEHGDQFVAFELPDFTMATAKGDSVTFSNLRGKVVYFYIWASYCGLSRTENQRLAAWYDAHPNADIEIVSYSIDKDEQAWRKAIAEDSLHWPIQWRGGFEWNSPEIRQFGVDHIPVSFLLDARGIIRTKAMHPEELERDYAMLVKRWGPQPKP